MEAEVHFKIMSALPKYYYIFSSIEYSWPAVRDIENDDQYSKDAYDLN